MINVKKGIAHSLAQADLRGTNPNPAQYGTGTALTAGSICNIDTTGYVNLGQTVTGGSIGLHGFAINNSYDGDAIESQKIALYSLDGISIIETDQVDLLGDNGSTTVAWALNSTNYPVGTPLYISTAHPGLVSLMPGNSSATLGAGYGTTSTGTKVNAGPIGWVEGIRFLQNATPYPAGIQTAAGQSYTSATETAAAAAETATSNGQPIYNPTSRTAYFKAQINVPVLSIKLNSFAGWTSATVTAPVSIA
jgi:hypothetical protein